MSGHPANRGPTRPLHTPSCNTPLLLPERKPTVSAHVITRDQAQAEEKDMGSQSSVPSESNTSNQNSWKARRTRRAASKKRQNEKEQSSMEGQNQTSEPVPLKKLGEYYEGNEGNTTLPVEYAGHSNLAILDYGAGVAIATKKVWENWGRPDLKQTCMKLQLADGSIERPIGLLEKVIVTACGVEYEHTFAVVDFGKSQIMTSFLDDRSCGNSK